MKASRPIKVLMYHKVIKEKRIDKKDVYAVYEHNFRRQLYFLDQLNFTPITFEDYYLYLEGKLSLPQKPIILTFDDGYQDTLEIALPILQQFNMKAVVFVMGNRELTYPVWDQSKDQNVTGNRLMSDEEILELRAKGFEIGAHGMSHHNLTELNSEQIHQEIYESKHMIEALLNEEIMSFAYPYGQVNRSVEHLVAQGGFKFGCGVYTGPPKFGDNLYNIRRLAIKLHTTTFRFLLKILAPYEYVEWLYWKAFHMKIADPQYPAKQNAHWHHRFSPTKNFQNSDS